MFPEAFVEKWVSRLTKPGELVMDPFCGRGTTPFQSLLMGRTALATDTNPVAYCITRAKTNAPTMPSLRRRITVLERGFDPSDWESMRRRTTEFFRHAFSPPTLRQLLYLRETLRWRDSSVDCMLAALTLGSLHGPNGENAPYLSNQMPRVISTKPAYSVRYWQRHGHIAPCRDAFALLRRQADFRYASDPPSGRAIVFNEDMRELPHISSNRTLPVRCVITSPPYLDVTSFEEDQWLRLWFLGGEPYPTRGQRSADDRHRGVETYWRLIADFWRTVGVLVAPRADVVIRIGIKGHNPTDVAEALVASSTASGRRVRLRGYEASEIRRRQTGAFRPGSAGCRREVDCHFSVR